MKFELDFIKIMWPYFKQKAIIKTNRAVNENYIQIIELDFRPTFMIRKKMEK
jgi:hypothetical protein